MSKYNAIRKENGKFNTWILEEEEAGGFFDPIEERKVRFFNELSEEGKEKAYEEFEATKEIKDIKKYRGLAFQGKLFALRWLLKRSKDFEEFKEPLENKTTKLDLSPSKDRRTKIKDMTQTKARNLYLEDVIFDDLDLSWSDFSGSTLVNCSFNNTTLTGAKFVNCSLQIVDFGGADLTLVDFKNVDLRATKDFGKATIKQINLSGADVRGVDLRGAGESKEDLFYVSPTTKFDVTNKKLITKVPTYMKKFEAQLKNIEECMEKGKQIRSETIKELKKHLNENVFKVFYGDRILKVVSFYKEELSWRRHLPDSWIPINFSLKDLKKFFRSTDDQVKNMVNKVNKKIGSKRYVLTDPVNTNSRANSLKSKIVYRGDLLGLSQTVPYYIIVNIEDSGFGIKRFYSPESYIFCIPQKSCSSKFEEFGQRELGTIVMKIEDLIWRDR
jgi:hypothetical protein